MALFAVVLWPSRSFAAIVPACEADFASTVALEPLDTSCDDGHDDDIDNSRVAPMCDARGASAIAPPRIRSVPDVRFEQHRPCQQGESVQSAVRSDRGDPPAPPPDALPDPAVLPVVELLAPSSEAQEIDPLAGPGGPRAGIRGDVYHPPR